MPGKKINQGADSRESILKGVNIVADLVGSTLGPSGRCICIRRLPAEPPFLTKDGVTVARDVQLEDPFEDAGARMVIDVAGKTCDEAGDGTTTATVLARAVYRAGLEAIKAGANPVVLQKGMNAMADSACEMLKSFATPVSDEFLEQVALISANGDREIAEKVVQAVKATGQDGVTVISESHSLDTVVDVVDGYHFAGGWTSPWFITDSERAVCELKDPLILLFDQKLQVIQDMLPLLKLIADLEQPILIIAEDIQGEAKAVLAVNAQKGTLRSCAVRCPGYGPTQRPMLDDIAALTGATVISADLGLNLKDVTMDHLGRAKGARMTEDMTVISEGAGEASKLQSRIVELRSAVDREQDQRMKEYLQARLSKLSGGVAAIKVGGASALEVEEKKFRVDDCQHAVRAAMAEGIVPGGGVALVRASKFDLNGTVMPKDFVWGMEIVSEAMREPFKQILSNAGFVDDKLSELDDAQPTIAYDARTGVKVDMIEAGIIDPVKVVRTALRNAVSIASLMLITEGMILAS